MSVQIRISCLCGTNQGTVQLPMTFPVETMECCCNICRYSTGVLFVASLHLTSPPPLSTRVKCYASSTKVSRHFCSQCGSHLYIENHQPHHRWSLNQGVVEQIVGAGTDIAETGLQKLGHHEFVADTIDGGLSICLTELGGQPVSFFARGTDEAPMRYVPRKRPVPFDNDLSSPAFEITGPPETKYEIRQDEKLHASCHCGGVQYFLTRPTAQSKELSAGWPDLLVAYHSAASTVNERGEKWWLRANDTKYLAGTCACRSCRLACGYPIQAWAFVPKPNIFRKDGEVVRFNEGKLKQFESSPGVFREFCDGCGATVFWHCSDRPDLIDVSVGLLRAREGARAENWLEWWIERVSFKEEAFDVKLIEALEKGLKNIALR